MSQNFLIRPIQEDDLQAVLDLAAKTGPGMTSLPADEKLLENKIKESLNSFKIDPIKPGNEAYRFVLVDLSKNKIIGIAAIRAKVGGYEPSYSYEIKKARHQSKELKVDKEIEFLELKSEHDGPSIISSLFLDPEYRKLKLGKRLSQSRFLFMADHKKRFTKNIIAEMRGVIDESGKSPFWEGTVKHFFDMEFDKADYLSSKDKAFIADLMPHFPIYIPLLDQKVQESIAEVHENTLPALRYLESENFAKDKHVDIFDAGPRISCPLEEIKSIKESQKRKLKINSEQDQNEKYLLSNCKLDFRVIHAPAKLSNDHIEISQESAELLELKEGEELRLAW